MPCFSLTLFGLSVGVLTLGYLQRFAGLSKVHSWSGIWQLGFCAVQLLGSITLAVFEMSNRLMKEIMRLREDPPVGISAAPQDNNIMLWNAVISGPEDTPWDGGTFKLTIQITQDYPRNPPIVRFVSRMFHPNIYTDGSICLDILQHQWSPVISLTTLLLSIQALLSDPNPDEPANSEAAQLFNENKRLYNRKVREIVEESQTADGPSGA